MKIFIITALTALLILSGCSLEEPDVKQSPEAQLNSVTKQLFAQYVALGNSLTAGYQSGALTEMHQKHSYVKKIAEQAGVGDQFIQPLIAYPGLGTYTAQGAGILKLQGFNETGSPIINPVPYALVGFNPLDPYTSASIKNHPAPYNNLGIPGIVLGDLDSAVTAVQSYSHSGLIDPILRNPAFGNTNPVEQALMLQPTLITCWIGNNDVLGYATSGGTNPAAPTPTAVFQGLYTLLLQKLTAGGTKVVVANIPDVTSIPFFTTVPYQVEVQGNMVALVIETAGGPRQATAEDLLLLTAQSIIGDVSGTYGPAGVPVGFDAAAPLPSAFVLDKDEIEVARTAVDEFNTAISTVAGQFNVPVVDINSLLVDASDEDGYPLAGIELSSKFISGGLFSLDGVHPTDIGSAFVANEWIATMNRELGTNIPEIDLLQFIDETQPLQLNAGPVSSEREMLMRIPEIFGGKIDL